MCVVIWWLCSRWLQWGHSTWGWWAVLATGVKWTICKSTSTRWKTWGWSGVLPFFPLLIMATVFPLFFVENPVLCWIHFDSFFLFFFWVYRELRHILSFSLGQKCEPENSANILICNDLKSRISSAGEVRCSEIRIFSNLLSSTRQFHYQGHQKTHK